MSIVKILEKTDCLIMASCCTCNILSAGASCMESVLSNTTARYWDMVFQTILNIKKSFSPMSSISLKLCRNSVTMRQSANAFPGRHVPWIWSNVGISWKANRYQWITHIHIPLVCMLWVEIPWFIASSLTVGVRIYMAQSMKLQMNSTKFTLPRNFHSLVLLGISANLRHGSSAVRDCLLLGSDKPRET